EDGSWQGDHHGGRLDGDVGVLALPDTGLVAAVSQRGGSAGAADVVAGHVCGVEGAWKRGYCEGGGCWGREDQCLGTLHTTDMSCYDICRPCGPTPLANSCNEPCVRQCEDSHVAIQPSTVVVTLPGPILSSFPQNTAVGSSASAAVGSNLSAQGVPISGGGFGGFGLGGLGGYGLGGLGCFSGRRACYPC
uniref:Keratin n=2 Tax=Anas platyrhynchos TaxID=8839 RepID=A0A8B9T9Q0_ANAPL